MRDWIALFENRARDATYDRFWWSEDDGFEDVNDTTHADHAYGFFSDIASGDYDDTINKIGNEEEANRFYMQRGCVRGGYQASTGTAYMAAMNLRLIRQCLQAMATEGRQVMAINIDYGRANAELDAEAIDTLIRTGRIPRKRVAEQMIVSDRAASDHDGRVRDLTIHHNPGRNDLMALLQNSQEKTLRGFLDDKTGDIYVWDAFVTDHAGGDRAMAANGYHAPFPRFIIELKDGLPTASGYIDHGMKEDDWLDAPTAKMDRALGRQTIWGWT